ncbi:MAG: hypothetical protein QOI24_1236 [Acidobacteriota bacterium]|jgi:hypothetical protein|nr:hypothetical protein [Acidobacteriota bacterium]
MNVNRNNGIGAAVPIVEDKSIAGSGRCKACGCRGYRPNIPKNDYCKDCGHSWHMHEGA